MKKIFISIQFIFLIGQLLFGQQHPSLILKNGGVATIRTGKAAPLFETTLDLAKSRLETAMAEDIDVPIPKDLGGGYTHEQHKRNYSNMQLAGLLYQLEDEDRYAAYTKEVLMEYAKLYPTLSLHPSDKSYAPGKLFWQCLNEANWLVYTSQAYDCIYDYLSAEERTYLEENLFKPFADFISIENPRFFNRIHNHSTWGNAAVGMMGIVMRDQELIDRALYGLKLDKKSLSAKDNDGGYIFEKGNSTAGFLAQIDHAFSPDGYYTEGPYYQRYAMTPFMLFAQALDNHNPELKIFEYRDSLLLKAVYALLDQTNEAGEFFPINDAQKGMSWLANSVISTVNIAYGQTKDPKLLDVARQQNRVNLDQNGYAIASDIASGKLVPFYKKSAMLRDGEKGQQGALAVIRGRTPEGEISVPFKCTAQGLGHGHYDKLSYSVFDGETEVLQDYGAARWVNVDQKAGGRYLKENQSWAKQTIAHNTLIVDQTSHFNGEYKIASKNHSNIVSYDFSGDQLQIVNAKETNAYKDVDMRRTVILWKTDLFRKPLLIDLMFAKSDEVKQFDLPFHYGGQLLQTNFEYTLNEPVSIMGEDHGYQHVYQEAASNIEEETIQFTWLKDRKFFTITSLAESGDEAILARVGANDPKYNLRRDPFWIHRKKEKQSPIFISAIESHGIYDPVSELPTGAYSKLSSIQLIHHDKDYTIFSLHTQTDEKSVVMVYHGEESSSKNSHRIQVGEQIFEWNGLIKINQ